MLLETRMRSSMMRTARLLTVSQHALGRGEGVCIPARTGQGGVYLSMHWAWGVCIPACTGQGRVSAQGGVCPGVCGRHPYRQTGVKTLLCCNFVAWGYYLKRLEKHLILYPCPPPTLFCFLL